MWPFSKKPVALDTRPSSVYVKDNLVNFVTGMGTHKDQSTYSRYLPEVGVDRMTADAIFRSSWLGKRVVTTIVDDMVREWRTPMWDGSQDEDGIFDIDREEQRLRVPKRVHSALKWARQFGGAVMVMITKDAMDRDAFAEPLDVEKVGKGDLLNLVVYDRWRVYGTPPNKRDYGNPDLLVPYLNQTMDDPNFGFPEHYYLADTGLQVHNSRCIRFDGEELSWYEWARNGMWHDSVYKSVIRALTSYDSLMAGASNLVNQANLDIFLASNFAGEISTAEGTERMKLRYELLNMMKSIYGVVVLDKEQESFERKPVAALTGVKELCDRFALDVSGAADVPVTRLFGQPPSGLNSDGESNLVNYENHIKARQTNDISPQLMQLDQVMVRSALGRMPEDYRFTWKPLRQMTDEQKADIELKGAQRDNFYITNKTIKPVVAARELRAAGTFPNMTQQDVDDTQKVSEEAEKLAAQLPQQPPPGQPINGKTKPPAFELRTEEEPQPTNGKSKKPAPVA